MSDQNKFNRAWQIYSLADQILHNRVEAMLVAEAFLVGAYAITTVDQNKEEHVWLLWLIIIFALLVTFVFGVTSWRIGEKMASLRRQPYFSKDPVWRVYDRGSNFMNKIRLRSAVPLLCLLFWIAVGAFEYFWK